MIINLILTVIIDLVSFIFSFVGSVTIADIPQIGTTISNGLLTMVTTWNAIIETVPYLEIVSFIFFWVIIPLEIGLLVLKFFLGSRVPAHTN